MSRHDYYEKLKSLAREMRGKYGLNTPRVLKSDLRRICHDVGVKIEYWPYKFKHLRGAYFNDGYGPPTMVLAKGLPDDPTIFTMGHELKHHLTDRNIAVSYCDPSNDSEPIEIGAEVFSAELIYPEEDFVNDLTGMGVTIGGCTPVHLVHLKHQKKSTLSYMGLAKRTVRLGFGPMEKFAKVKWMSLEKQIYGEPMYKRINRYRRSR